MQRAIHGVMLTVARALALIGGGVLLALIVMTCLSIAGRHLAAALGSEAAQTLVPGLADALLGLGVGRVFGDFEMTELGMAFAIFCFLPYCHITLGHARVDVFTSALSDRVNRWLRLVAEAAFFLALALIAWRLSVGMSNRLRTGQTTYILEWPVWMPYAACLGAAVVAVVVAAYMLAVRMIEAVQDRDIIDEPGEAER